jgi:hypothetical protein
VSSAVSMGHHSPNAVCGFACCAARLVWAAISVPAWQSCSSSRVPQGSRGVNVVRRCLLARGLSACATACFVGCSSRCVACSAVLWHFRAHAAIPLQPCPIVQCCRRVSNTWAAQIRCGRGQMPAQVPTDVTTAPLRSHSCCPSPAIAAALSAIHSPGLTAVGADSSLTQLLLCSALSQVRSAKGARTGRKICPVLAILASALTVQAARATLGVWRLGMHSNRPLSA